MHDNFSMPPKEIESTYNAAIGQSSSCHSLQLHMDAINLKKKKKKNNNNRLKQ